MNPGGEQLYRAAADSIPHLGGPRLKRLENTFIRRELPVPASLTARLLELGWSPSPNAR